MRLPHSFISFSSHQGKDVRGKNASSAEVHCAHAGEEESGYSADAEKCVGG